MNLHNFLDAQIRMSAPKTTKRGLSLIGSFSLGCATHQIGTHEVRPALTSKGFAYYFDKVGNAYIWCVKGNTKGMLVLQKPSSRLSPCSIATGRGKQGYLFLKSGSGSCYGKNDKGCLLVHRGVAMAFPEICGLPDIFRNQIDHINGDKHDNRVCNLRWVSNSENMKAAYAAKKAAECTI